MALSADNSNGLFGNANPLFVGMASTKLINHLHNGTQREPHSHNWNPPSSLVSEVSGTAASRGFMVPTRTSGATYLESRLTAFLDC